MSWTSGATTLAGLSEKNHASLEGVTADQHHDQSHSDADHFGANKVAVYMRGILRGTRKNLNFLGGTGTDMGDTLDRVDISFPGRLSFIAGSGVAWAMPLAETELIGSTSRRLQHDAQSHKQARLFANLAATPAAGRTLRPQYSLDAGANWNYAEASGTGLQISLNSLPAMSSFVDLASAACADALWRIVGAGGDGAASSSFIQVQIEFR